MGHDITAYPREFSTDEAREAKYAEMVGEHGKYDDAWSVRYAAYRTATEVAYFRRSMGYYRGPVGALLYKILGPKAEALYAGVSGNGESARFGREEIGMALVHLKRMKQERDDDAVDDELAFVSACADYLTDGGHPDIEIYFG